MTDQAESGASTDSLGYQEAAAKRRSKLIARNPYDGSCACCGGRGVHETWCDFYPSVRSWEERDQLRADLERVTAELENYSGVISDLRAEADIAHADAQRLTAERRSVEERAGQREQELHNKHAEAIVQFTREVRRLEAERDAMREVAEAADGMRDCQMVVGSQCDHMRRVNGALARLAATCKVTTDAAEGARA